MEYIQVLKQCPLFKGLAEQDIQALLAGVPTVQKLYQAGESIVHTGDAAKTMGIILEGSLELRNYLPNGNSIRIFHRSAGEVIGCAIMFSKKQTYPFNILASTPCRLLFIRKPDFICLLTRNTGFMGNMLELFAERITHFDYRLELLAYSSIQKKIAYSLLHDFQCNAGAEIQLPFTKQVWADYLNVSRPSLSRELKVMAEAGILSLAKERIRIVDKKKLERLLEE